LITSICFTYIVHNYIIYAICVVQIFYGIGHKIKCYYNNIQYCELCSKDKLYSGQGSLENRGRIKKSSKCKSTNLGTLVLSVITLVITNK